MDPSVQNSGACLCGQVRFEIKAKLKNVIACHCKQCRSWSGHFWASTACPTAHITFINDASLRWYNSSEHARRGFCTTCSSSLFWKLNKDGEKEDYYAIAAGALETPTNLTIERHIFCIFKGDYYSIDDQEQQYEN